MTIRLLIREGAPLLPAGIHSHPTFESWQDLSGREYGFGFQQDADYCMRLHNLGSYVARSDGGEVLGYPDPGVSREWFREFFFHFVVPLLLQRWDWDCLHASAVATAAGVVALCGPSGRGKSTLARAWCERGVLPHTDDSVPFLIRGERVLSAPLPQQPRLRGPAADWFRCAPRGLWPAPEDGWLDLEAQQRPLAAVYWLAGRSEAGASETLRAELIPSHDAFLLLLGEAHCFTRRDRQSDRKMVRNYLRLAELTPVYRLFYPAGLDQIPRVLSFLESNERERLESRRDERAPHARS